MNPINIMSIPTLTLGVAAIAQVVTPDGSQLDHILNQFIDVGLVGAVAVMFYPFWRMTTTENDKLQDVRLEELQRQRDEALEQRDKWYEENMKQCRERLAIYQSFIDERSIIVRADDIIHPDDIAVHIDVDPSKTASEG